MFYACEYDASGEILEARGGRAAIAFLRAYSGSNTLRISEAHDEFPDLEVGPVYRAGYNIDGTPPAPRQVYSDELQKALATMRPADVRAHIVRVMKRKARQILEPYREAADSDFGDPDLLAEGIALRNQLKAVIQAAAAATSEAELTAAWNEIKSIGG